MELIKKIKQAEAQAQEIVEQAKAKADKLAAEERANRLKRIEEAERQRKKAIEAALSAAKKQGLVEVDNLKAKAEKQRQQLHDKAADKIPAATAKVMEQLRG